MIINGREVTKVYSGRSGCACGCRGKYSDTSRSIKTIVNKMFKLGNVEFDGDHFFVETETRLYIAYFA